jgi:hypothetical protein
MGKRNKKPKFVGGGKTKLTKEGRRKQAEVKFDRLAVDLHEVKGGLEVVRQLTEANRIGVITVNSLMTKSDWPHNLTKLQQFIFGLAQILEEQHPGLVKQVHAVMNNGDLSPDIGAILGDPSVKVGYTEDEFNEAYMANFSKIHGEDQQSTQREDISDKDEEGSDDDSLNVDLERIGKSVSDQQGSEFFNEVIAVGVPEEESVAETPEPEPHTATKPCEFCKVLFHKPLELSQYHWENKKYCSKSCARKARRAAKGK